LDTVDGIKGMAEGSIKVFFAMGGNFLSATPDTLFTAQALKKCRLTVQVSTKLNRAHLITGEQALILPCLGRTEIDLQESGPQFVTVEDSMGIISSSRGSLGPASEHLLSETMIVAQVAKATLGQKSKIEWEKLAGNYDRIRDHIEHVISGFDQFNERVRKDIFYLPNPVRDSRKFYTRTGKAEFTVHQLSSTQLEKGKYWMMTIRSHDQFNTTIYGLDDRYRGVFNGRRVIFMNESDIKREGFQQGQFVDITSHFEGKTRKAEAFMVAPYEIPEGCTATYFPETNVLIPIESSADESNTPTSKSIVVSLAASARTSEAVANLEKEIVAHS
jgi:molybdopterin-dependent oxidoreductase alpha subunit